MSDSAAARSEADARFHAKLLEELDAAVVAWDADGRVTHCSTGAERLFGWSSAELVGRRIDWTRGFAAAPEELARGEAWAGERLVPTAAGASVPVSVRLAPLHAPDGTPEGFIAVAYDLTERRRAAAQLERRIGQQAAVAQLGERALEGMEIAALEQLAVELAAAHMDLAGAAFMELDRARGLLRPSATVGVAPHALEDWVVRTDAARPSAVVLRTGEPVVVDDWGLPHAYEMPRPAATAHHGSSMVVAVKGRDAAIGTLAAYGRDPHAFTVDDLHFLQAIANVLSDAIERVRTESAVRFQALHDRVTGLPNRALFLDRLGHALTLGGRQRRDLAVLFLDLDHFKRVNDTQGHAAGDDLLQQVAPRLRGAVRPADTVARFGGDEFVLLCEDVDEVHAADIAKRVLAAFAAPFVVEGQDHFLTTSVGIALTGRAGATADGLVRDADAAMYRAKDRGRGRYEIFDEDMRHRALARLRLESELRRAVDRDELELHYQPVVALRTGAVVGGEALVRWNHPERGRLGAAEFVPLAEETGLMVPITRWVLHEALGQVALWRAEHPPARRLVVGVNVSCADVARPDFEEVVLAALAASGVAPDALSLEITEPALVDPSDGTVDTLRRLQELGCMVTLDDFGTGYSSLRHLESFPATTLKIGRAFVARLQEGIDHAPVVRAIVGLGAALGLVVVAEGVETAEQEAGLRELGCRTAQGFRYSAPLPADAFGRLLASPAAARTRG
jgi:diguanylate cyclase (GGDEF)-like protein/PAS domain S-box-containing protein